MVVPGDVARPTGGNVWDREVAAALRSRGTAVRWRPVPGRWPRPSEGPTALLAALAEAPDGAAVLVDGLVAGAWPQALAAHSARLRLAVVVHLPLALETGLDPAEAARLDALEVGTLRVAAVVLTTSAWCAEQVRARAGSAPVVARPGTRPPDGWQPAPADARPGPHLLAVGALVPRKGHDVLLRALARLPEDAGWRLRVVGPEPDEGPARAHAAALREAAAGEDRVELLGPRTGAALEEQWRWADLLVVPSWWETFGMVATEALVRGVPCVVSDGSGLVEAVGGDPEPPALLVPAGDEVALATALGRWLDDGALRARLRSRAADRREELRGDGWESTAAAVAAAVLGGAA
jgi:glycosyltransferase involved in cell wall biosynthesis